MHIVVGKSGERWINSEAIEMQQLYLFSNEI
jgi:hypothetical protein